MNCKAAIAMELCKCKPYFYHNYPGPDCTPEGYACLLVQYFPQNYIKRCVCTQTCINYSFQKNSMKLSKWAKQSSVTLVQKSSVRYEIVTGKIKMRRDVLFRFVDMLVSFGGVASFFLGISTLDVFRKFYELLETIIDYFAARKRKNMKFKKMVAYNKHKKYKKMQEKIKLDRNKVSHSYIVHERFLKRRGAITKAENILK